MSRVEDFSDNQRVVIIGAPPRYMKKTLNAESAETAEKVGIPGALGVPGGDGQTETVRLMAEADCGRD